VTGDARVRLRETAGAALHNIRTPGNRGWWCAVCIGEAGVVLDALTDDDLADLLGLERREYCGICTVDLSWHPTPICKGKPGLWHWVGPWQLVEPT
jgi:hypothetical protein